MMQTYESFDGVLVSSFLLSHKVLRYATNNLMGYTMTKGRSSYQCKIVANKQRTETDQCDT
jgi:hypothetical protein